MKMQQMHIQNRITLLEWVPYYTIQSDKAQIIQKEGYIKMTEIISSEQVIGQSRRDVNSIPQEWKDQHE
jgi:hypothetical protein